MLRVPARRGGQLKVRLADLMKVGPEGYVHGFICVRPPCGAYTQAKIDKKKGTVTHNGERIGRVPSKDADGKYSAVYISRDADGTVQRHKLAGRFNTPSAAFAVLPLYHNVKVLQDSGVVGDKDGTEEGRELSQVADALENGDFDAAARHLEHTRDVARSRGNHALEGHADHLLGAVKTAEAPESDTRIQKAVHQEQAELREQLTKSVAAGLKENREPLVTGGIADTSIITFNDGNTYVRKRLKIPNGYNSDKVADEENRELAAPLVARALGLDAPMTVDADSIPGFFHDENGVKTDIAGVVNEEGERTLLMPFIQGKTVAQAGRFFRSLANDPDEKLSDQMNKIGLLDTIIQNSDRHIGNLMIGDDGNLHPIDHGFAWRHGGSESANILSISKLSSDYLRQSHANLLALQPDIESLIGPERFASTLSELTAKERMKQLMDQGKL